MSKPNVVTMSVPRKYVLRSTKGYAIAFEKDKPIDVPAVLIEEVLAIGGQFADKKVAEENFKEREARKELTAEERLAALEAAFKALIDKNDANDFAASGVPTLAAIEKQSGIRFDQKEVRNGWMNYRARLGAENQ
jgi:hypothetical protein